MEGKQIETRPYAEVFGILALILAIVSIMITLGLMLISTSSIGVLLSAAGFSFKFDKIPFIIPLAMIFNIIALRGGLKGMGKATLIILTVNLIITPGFWMNILVDFSKPYAWVDLLITYICVIGIVLMFVFTVRKRGKSI